MPYTINGSAASGVDEPVLDGDTTFVPIAKITEMLGGYVTWDNMTKVASIELGSKKVRVQADDPDVEIDGQMETLQAAPYVEGTSMWVPVRFFSNVLGASLSVDGDNITLSA